MVVFHQMPYFLQHFAKNWYKTLVHGTLQKKLLISRRSTSFGGSSPNALLFATFFQKLGQNPSARYFAEKVAYLEEIDKFWWFFHQMPYFLQHFAKNWVKTLVHATLQKKLLISRRSTSFGGFSPNAILFSTFC